MAVKAFATKDRVRPAGAPAISRRHRVRMAPTTFRVFDSGVLKSHSYSQLLKLTDV